MAKTIGIYSLEQGDRGGIDVYFKDEVIRNVHPNIVRCALGEADTEYLLTSDAYNESGCFRILESEYEDFLKHRV